MLNKVGLARCIKEPRDGEYGLEGYNLGTDYKFEIVEDGLGDIFLVYPGTGSDIPANMGSLTYYEPCSHAIFNKFFEILRMDTPRNPDVCVVKKPKWA